MKKLTIILFLFLTTQLSSFSQKRDNKIYNTVDSFPEFVYSGCNNTNDCIDLFISTHKKWPPVEDGVVATIIIQCVVEKMEN